MREVWGGLPSHFQVYGLEFNVLVPFEIVSEFFIRGTNTCRNVHLLRFGARLGVDVSFCMCDDTDQRVMYGWT
jgi:hypothetical protein